MENCVFQLPRSFETYRCCTKHASEQKILREKGCWGEGEGREREKERSVCGENVNERKIMKFIYE